jgi:hypothetical protein
MHFFNVFVSIDELNQSIICLENLFNELLYEISDYFDGIDIYHAFIDLNHRFQQLLSSLPLLFKIELDH